MPGPEGFSRQTDRQAKVGERAVGFFCFCRRRRGLLPIGWRFGCNSVGDGFLSVLVYGLASGLGLGFGRFCLSWVKRVCLLAQRLELAVGRL